MHVQPGLAHNWLIFCYNTNGNCKYRARESGAGIQGGTATLREIERNFHV